MSIISQPMVEYALSYAKKGWPVFPLTTVNEKGVCSCYRGEKCENAGKHPQWHEKKLRNGFKNATTNENQILEWWQMWPNANIGIVTGSKSGLVVLDIDIKHGGHVSLDGLIADHGPLPDTVEAETGSGGRHFLFKHPGWFVKNSEGEIAPGVDIRGDGGYIVAAPSLHKSGKRYEWEISSDPEDIHPSEIPEWLADRLKTKVDQTTEIVKAKTTGKVWQRYLTGGIIQEGGRDNTLFSIGCNMRSHGAGYEDIQATLIKVNETRCRPQLGYHQVLQKVDQAVKYPPGKSGLLNFPATDWGNAERLIDRHGADLRYCAKMGGWHIWDGKRWVLDETGEVFRRAAETLRAYRQEAEKQLNEIEKQLKQATANEQEKLETKKKEAAQVVKFSKQSEFKSRITAMIDLAQNLPGVPITTDQLDHSPWLITVNNGTLDLKTGKLQEHRREDLITKLTPVDYDPKAECPQWLGFLDRIMGGDRELISFLQKAAGYALTGDTSEQVMFFLYGAGANGKSVYLNTLQDLMGDYGQQAPTSLLMAKPSTGVPNDVARLKGARFVTAIETGEGNRMDETLVKQLTGDDPVTARFLRQEFFTFKSEGKIFLASNHKPLIRGNDYAIWRRIHLIPFEVQIPVEERDKQLPAKLREEMAGILKWAVDGCLQWLSDGLQPPKKVTAATEDYKTEMDGMGTFINDCCVENWDAKVSVSGLYKAYVEWCEENGERPMNQRMFSKRMKERGYKQKKSTGGKRVWDGIGISYDGTDTGQGLAEVAATREQEQQPERRRGRL